MTGSVSDKLRVIKKTSRMGGLDRTIGARSAGDFLHRGFPVDRGKPVEGCRWLPPRPSRSFRAGWWCALAHAKELAETAETDATAAVGGSGIAAVADRVFTELLEVAASPRDDRFPFFAGDQQFAIRTDGRRGEAAAEPLLPDLLNPSPRLGAASAAQPTEQNHRTHEHHAARHTSPESDESDKSGVCPAT